jgi:hypothetical protein
MKTPRKAIETVASAASDRLHGENPSPVRAATAATVVGAGTGAIVYKLLRR